MKFHLFIGVQYCLSIVLECGIGGGSDGQNPGYVPGS